MPSLAIADTHSTSLDPLLVGVGLAKISLLIHSTFSKTVAILCHYPSTYSYTDRAGPKAGPFGPTL